jgi:hypothetical protein
VSRRAIAITKACFALSCFACQSSKLSSERGNDALSFTGVPKMIKTLCAAAAVFAFASTAAYSAEEKMACDDATVMKMEEGAMAMKDPAQKDAMMMAMKEVEMAKASMKDGKMDDCSMHLGEAMKAQAPKM